jgi:hypothetical protein
MSFTLTGTRYIGTGALPTPVLGYDCVATDTGNFYVANSTATAWVLVGSVNSPNLGMLPLTGGTMTGNVAGATGWAPNDSPNFTTSAKLNGVDLATTTNLSDTSTTILNGIAPKITEAIASTSSGLTVKSNIARDVGLLTFTDTTPQTIPLPIYPDGTTASESDCKWIAFLVGNSVSGNWAMGWPCGRSDGNGDAGLIFSANPTTTRTFNAVLTDKGGNKYPTIIGYFIEAIKS